MAIQFFSAFVRIVISCSKLHSASDVNISCHFASQSHLNFYVRIQTHSYVIQFSL